MAKVVGVHTIVMHEPGRSIIPGEQVDEQTIQGIGHRSDLSVELLEQPQVRMGPHLPSDAEIGHKIGPWQHDQGGTVVPDSSDQDQKIFGKLRQGCSAASIVQTVADDEQIRSVFEHVFLESLQARRFATVLVGGTASRDDIGADPRVDQTHRLRLHVADQNRQSRRPTAFA